MAQQQPPRSASRDAIIPVDALHVPPNSARNTLTPWLTPSASDTTIVRRLQLLVSSQRTVTTASNESLSAIRLQRQSCERFTGFALGLGGLAASTIFQR